MTIRASRQDRSGQNTPRNSWLRALTIPVGAILALFASHDALAANIGVNVGVPKSGGWNTTCSSRGIPHLPSGASQLPACSGSGCMDRVDIDTAEFPQAVCNDGSPGVFYVRAGTAADASRWVIHLQGGGSCETGDSCLDRYCGVDAPYTANKMSSDFNLDGTIDLPEHASAPGMSSASSGNRFSTWTQVWVYYCSSDQWLGRASDVTVSGASFTIDMRGHTILSAVRKMLRKMNADPGKTAALNDLDDATEIVFTGTSAGAKGAIENADWFLEPFPNADRSLVVDANFDFTDGVLWDDDVWVHDPNGIGDMNFYSGRIELTNADWAAGGFDSLIDAFADESCRDYYEPMARMDRCSEISTLLSLSLASGPLISTPTFVRLDLEDKVISQNYTVHPNENGYSLLIGGPAGTPTGMSDFRSHARASLLEVYLEQRSMTGVLAPRCGQHVGLEDASTFGVSRTPDTDESTSPPALVPGTDITYHDALWTWLNVGGGGTRVPIRRLDTDDPASAPYSYCR
jgi:hypothetical protein